MLLACVVRAAGDKLEEAGLLKPVGEAVVRYSKEEKLAVKVAAGRAAMRLAVANRAALGGVVNIMVTLLGPDQPSELQRQALLCLRQAVSAGGGPSLLEPHFGTLLPSICYLVANTAGPTRAACELTLQKVLDLREGGDLELAQRFLASGAAGPSVRSCLTEAFLARLAKMGEEAEDFTTEEY